MCHRVQADTFQATFGKRLKSFQNNNLSNAQLSQVFSTFPCKWLIDTTPSSLKMFKHPKQNSTTSALICTILSKFTDTQIVKEKEKEGLNSYYLFPQPLETINPTNPELIKQLTLLSTCVHIYHNKPLCTQRSHCTHGRL